MKENCSPSPNFPGLVHSICVCVSNSCVYAVMTMTQETKTLNNLLT